MKKINAYITGLDPDIISRRVTNRDRIMKYLGADAADWADYRWQQKNVFRDARSIA